MPLSVFQKSVLAVLAKNRAPESNFAGGIISNATDASPRYSRDFDTFHEVAVEVVRASEADIESLRSAHFDVEPAPRFDSAFRFFPIVQDPLLG